MVLGAAAKWSAAPLRAAKIAVRGLVQAAALSVLIGGGIVIYAVALQLFGVTGWREAVNALRNAPRDLRK